MRPIQKFTVIFAALLILLNVSSAFPVSAESLKKTVSTNTIQERESLPKRSVSTGAGSSLSDNNVKAENNNSLSDNDANKENNNSLSDDSVKMECEDSLSDNHADLNEMNLPSATVEVITEGEQPGLYLIINNIPEGQCDIWVNHSFGGISYNLISNKYWYDAEKLEENGKISLLCYELNEHPLTAFQTGASSNLYIKVSYSIDNGQIQEIEPIRLSSDKIYEIPAVPPQFWADIKLGDYSYYMEGHFSAFPPNVAQVRTTYSWDGIHYSNSPIMWKLESLGNGDEKAKKRLENQEIFEYYHEPLSSFLAGDQDSFYVRLEITTEDNKIYYSQPDFFSRGDTQLVPAHLTPIAYFGFDFAAYEMRDSDGNLIEPDEDSYFPENMATHTFGQIQLTVPDDITEKEVRALLPDTVPVRIRLWDNNSKEKYAFGDVECKVEWKEIPPLSLTAWESVVLDDMALPLSVPAGTKVETLLGNYILKSPLKFRSRRDRDDIKVILNTVPKGYEPRAALDGYNLDIGEENTAMIDGPLRLAFWNKPSGATSIKTYLTVDNNRTEICDLLDRRNINHNQSHELYGYIDLIQADEYPLNDYLNNKLDEFTIDIEIEGGVFDGQSFSLAWPMEYDKPVEIYEPRGIDGSENNAGSDLDEDNYDSSEDGGQRPNLPDEGILGEDYAPPNHNSSPSSGNPAFSETIAGVDKAESITDTTISEEPKQSSETGIQGNTNRQETQKNTVIHETADLGQNSSGASAEIAKEEKEDVLVWEPTYTEEKPERVLQGSSIPLAVAGGLLLTGCAVTVGIASSSGASTAVTGVFSKLLGNIRHLFKSL